MDYPIDKLDFILQKGSADLSELIRELTLGLNIRQKNLSH